MPRGSLATLLVVVGCTPAAETARLPPAPQPAPARSALPAPSTSVTPSLPPAPTAPADVGSFRLRVTVVAGSDLTCDPSFWDFDVLPSGTAWFAGGCGARLRADPRGKVDDFRAPWKSVRFNAYGNVFARCPGTATFWGIWARSETEAYVVGDTRCGTDPNSIWYRPLEKFDGARWQSTNVAFGAGPHEGIPWELSGNAHELYTLVEGDDWHGPPECGLYRFSKGKWGKAELS